MADLNSTIVRGKLRVTEDINVNGNIAGSSITGNGSGLTGLNASNISSGTLSADRLATSGATAGSYGPSSNATPAYGAKFNVPYITIDNKGRVTRAETKTVTIPASDNSDTKNTAGAKNDAGKLYLIGAREQTDNPQTYSHLGVYMESGTLTADVLSTSVMVSPNNSLDLKFKSDSGMVSGVAGFYYSSLGGSYLNMTGHLLLNEAGAHPDKPENKTGLNYMSYANYFDTGIAVVGKRTSSDLPSIIRLSFPAKAGTIALTDDLSTLLDKGTSSTVVNQVVYNPVEMKKALKVPSIRGENSGNNHMNGAPLYSLGSTMATENGQATGSSSLSLTGYTGATGNPRSTIIAQRASGDFVISPDQWRGSKDLCFSDSSDKWTIAGSPILTESSISTQQWNLTSTTGTVTTVNICTKK